MEKDLQEVVVNSTTVESESLSQQEPILSKIRKPNGKKRIMQSAMPQKGLQEVVNVSKNMYKTLKQEVVPLETISTLIGIKQKSSNFTDILNAAEAYGIVQKEENGYSVSELGRKIVAPAIDGEDKEAIRQAIFTPTLLSRIYTDFNKRPIPADDIFKNALEITYGIPEEKVDRTKEIILG